MKRKLTQLSKAIANISPAEFLSMESSDLAQLERLSNCLSNQIELQNIWRGESITISKQETNQ